MSEPHSLTSPTKYRQTCLHSISEQPEGLTHEIAEYTICLETRLERLNVQLVEKQNTIVGNEYEIRRLEEIIAGYQCKGMSSPPDAITKQRTDELEQSNRILEQKLKLAQTNLYDSAVRFRNQVDKSVGLKQKLDRCQLALKQKQQDIDQVESILVAKNAQIEQIKEHQNNTSEQFATLEAEFSLLKRDFGARYQAVKQDASTKDREIARLQLQLNTVNEVCSVKESKIRTFGFYLNSLKESDRINQAKIARLKDFIDNLEQNVVAAYKEHVKASSAPGTSHPTAASTCPDVSGRSPSLCHQHLNNTSSGLSCNESHMAMKEGQNSQEESMSLLETYFAGEED